MPWANTATSLIRRDRSPSLSTRGSQLADEVAHPQPGQLGAVRHRADEPEPALGQRLAQLCCRGRIRRRHAVDHTADHACVLARRVPAGRDGEPLSQALSSACDPGPAWAQARSARWPPPAASAAGQLAASRTSASSALASAWLSPLAYSLAGPGLSPSTTTTSYLSMDGLPGSDGLLEHHVQSTRSKLLLQLGRGEWIWRAQRSRGRDQRGRAVGATIVAGLGHRLDEADVHALPVEGPHHAQAGPGQASASRGGHDQQGPGHDVILSRRR